MSTGPTDVPADTLVAFWNARTNCWALLGSIGARDQLVAAVRTVMSTGPAPTLLPNLDSADDGDRLHDAAQATGQTLMIMEEDS